MEIKIGVISPDEFPIIDIWNVDGPQSALCRIQVQFGCIILIAIAISHAD